MNYTDIEWCDMTWNPVTGCLHGCEYCYARGTVRRFGSVTLDSGLHILDKPYRELDIHCEFGYHAMDGRINSYPYGFAPTFHRHRLNEPARKKAPQNIFVVSMGDLFGNWVPDEWIKAVFEACEAAPWHNYMFLTKNPDRYTQLVEKDILQRSDNYWFGTTATKQRDPFWRCDSENTFLSIEPILEPLSYCEAGPIASINWVIIGAETGNRKNKVIPEREWIEKIVQTCREAGAAVFMKNSLAGIWGEPLIQEYPAGLIKK